VANRFVVYLARKTLERVRHGKGRAAHLDTDVQHRHTELMTDAMAEMEAWLKQPSEERRRRLLELQGRMRSQQNEHKNIPYGAVRLIHDWDLLVFENALNCMLHPAHAAGHWSYQLARDYAERYNPSEGTGLISTSLSLVQDIVNFWLQEYSLDLDMLAAPASQKKVKIEPPPASGSRMSKGAGKKAKFTPRQGQFLAFIHLYRKLHRQGPAEHELVRYFQVTPPAVHGMIVKLEELGLITREPGVPRSARVAIPEAKIPPLQDMEGPAW
jgi:hypothetical protein